MKVTRREFVGMTAAALAASPGAVERTEATFTVTLELLEEWGACERAVKWFVETYPKGITDTMAGLVARIPEDWPYDALWLLHQVAKRSGGPEGEDAYRLLVEKADPSRLANAVLELDTRDTSAALDRLVASGDAAQLERVARDGKGEAKTRAEAALTAKGVV